MGVEGCTKCIKYLLFVFNFVFWVSPEPRVGGRSPSLAGRAPLDPAKEAQPGRQVAGPPVCAERVVGGPRPVGRSGGARLGPPCTSRVGRGPPRRVSGLCASGPQSPAAGPGRLGTWDLFPVGDGGGAVGARSEPSTRPLLQPSWPLFLGPPCFAGTEGLEGGAPDAPPP